MATSSIKKSLQESWRARARTCKQERRHAKQERLHAKGRLHAIERRPRGIVCKLTLGSPLPQSLVLCGQGFRGDFRNSPQERKGYRRAHEGSQSVRLLPIAALTGKRGRMRRLTGPVSPHVRRSHGAASPFEAEHAPAEKEVAIQPRCHHLLIEPMCLGFRAGCDGLMKAIVVWIP